MTDSLKRKPQNAKTQKIQTPEGSGVGNTQIATPRMQIHKMQPQKSIGAGISGNVIPQNTNTHNTTPQKAYVTRSPNQKHHNGNFQNATHKRQQC